jgi:hypothetical protein
LGYVCATARLQLGYAWDTLRLRLVTIRLQFGDNQLWAAKNLEMMLHVGYDSAAIVPQAAYE